MILSTIIWKFCENDTITIPIKSRMEIICAGFVIFFVAFGKYFAKTRPNTIGTPSRSKICSNIGINGICSVGICALILTIWL